MAYLTNREQGAAGGFSSPSGTLFCLDKVGRTQEVEHSERSWVVQLKEAQACSLNTDH